MSAYCRFAPGDPIHGLYHDTEYGFPTEEESVLFERLMLEINQAGLSWATILKKRASFRAAYADFTVDRVAAFGPPRSTACSAMLGSSATGSRSKPPSKMPSDSRRYGNRTGRLPAGCTRITHARRRRGRSSFAERFASPEGRSSANS